MTGYLTPHEVRGKLKDRAGLTHFLGNELGYKTNPVIFQAADLGISEGSSKQISGMWLLSHYAGNLPFQIFLVHLKERPTFGYCAGLIHSFGKRRPGYYLFILTMDYSYILFMSIELSLERIPKPGKSVWPFGSKPYPRFLLIDSENLTTDDIYVLSRMKRDPKVVDPAEIHTRVIQALKSLDNHSPFPEWFLPYFYGLHDPSMLCVEIDKVAERLCQAESSLMDWLERPFVYGKLDEATTCLGLVLEFGESQELLNEEERGRLCDAIDRIGDAQEYSESDEENERTLALQEAIGCIDHVILVLRCNQKLLQRGESDGE